MIPFETDQFSTYAIIYDARPMISPLLALIPLGIGGIILFFILFKNKKKKEVQA